MGLELPITILFVLYSTDWTTLFVLYSTDWTTLGDLLLTIANALQWDLNQQSLYYLFFTLPTLGDFY